MVTYSILFASVTANQYSCTQGGNRPVRFWYEETSCLFQIDTAQECSTYAGDKAILRGKQMGEEASRTGQKTKLHR